MTDSLFLVSSKFVHVNKQVKNRKLPTRPSKTFYESKKGLVVILWINGFDKGMCLV